jgi:hypothetical protein
MSGFEVAYTSELTGGIDQCTDNDPCIKQNFIIRQDDLTGQTNGNWLGWVFIALGILSSMLFVIELLPRDEGLGIRT